MKKLIFCFILLSSCATLDKFFNPKFEYCGDVDTLKVYRKDLSSMTCAEALSTTTSAYNLLRTKGPGPLIEMWEVVYMWGAIDISDPLARTTPMRHLIQVQDHTPESIFHELGHAHMFEARIHMHQHATMCADKVWLQLERDFGVRPYCHLVRGEDD